MLERLDRLTRRRFLNMSLDVGTALFSFAIAAAGLMRMPLPKVLPDPSRRFRVGKGKDFPPGTERYFERQRVLVRADAKGIFAISMVCTHLGCTVAKEQKGGFLCPCHGSRYTDDGDILAGPAPRGLKSLKLKREVSGWLQVDASQEVSSEARLEA